RPSKKSLRCLILGGLRCSVQYMILTEIGRGIILPVGSAIRKCLRLSQLLS
ncbi:unnamed protein product, partial [Arabidopsis halleri]